MAPRESAFACYDILAIIFDHLAPARRDDSRENEELREECRKALASSATTCSTLSHHALNVLWRELDSIHPLLRTLPNFKLVRSQFTLSGAISDESWSRSRLYADRVRAVVGSIKHMDPIHPSVWVFLATKCQGSPLMPRLRRFLALDVCLEDAPGLILLMSPSLRVLEICFTLDYELLEDYRIIPHVVSSLMETLPVMAPNLESLHCKADVDLDHGYLKAFSQFTRLKALCITSFYLNEGALWGLSEIATLRGLSCSINLLDSSTSTLHPYVFQSLAELHVAGPFDDLTTFIDSCRFPRLTHINLSMTRSPRARELMDAFAAVSRRCNPTLLTSFGTSFNHTFPSPPPNFFMQHLEPLLTFSNVNRFSLSFVHSIPSIRDDNLAHFGAAWPRLESFCVACLAVTVRRRATHEVVRPTLSGVVDLARQCPHLEAFRIPELDASVVPEKTTTLPLGHSLRTFWVDNVILPSPESPLYFESATVFDRVFPSINLEAAQRVFTGSHPTGWKKFLGQLEIMRHGGTSEGGNP